MIHDREVPGSIPAKIGNYFSVWFMDVVGKPHNHLGAKAYYYFMNYAPLTYLTLNRLNKSLMVGHEKQTFKQRVIT